MGDVFEAQDLQLPRSVAVKVLKPSLLTSVTAVKRFQREAWLSASLNHPNICTILELGQCDGLSFIAMELLQGESLKQRRRHSPRFNAREYFSHQKRRHQAARLRSGQDARRWRRSGAERHHYLGRND